MALGMAHVHAEAPAVNANKGRSKDDHGIRGLSEWAHTVSDLATVTWKGPRVAWINEESMCGSGRPQSKTTRASSVHPLALHDTVGLDSSKLSKILSVLESIRLALQSMGWRMESSDGLEGEGLGVFDIYLVDGRSRFCTEHVSHIALLDTVTGYGELSVSDAANPDRIRQFYADVVLKMKEPAESDTWRKSISGVIGLGETPNAAEADDSVWDLSESWIARGHSSTWLLQRLEKRFKGFVSDVWELTRQRTWEGEGFRASPSGWEACAQLLKSKRASLENELIDAAEARLVWGLQHGVSLPTVTSTALPSHFRPSEPSVSVHGSTAVRLDVSGTQMPHQVFEYWLEAETGVRWAWSVVRLDGSGNLVGSVSAPPRESYRQFVPVEWTPETRSLIAIATIVPKKPIDISGSHEWVRSARFIISRK